MGKDINGRIVTADLNTMPHLLIAGSTGSGKSVAINAFIMSILYKATPEEVRLILVDPKRLELGNYEGVPHLHTPIITEPKLASNALRNAVREMERRLKVLAEKGVRNIDQYNQLFDGGTPSLFDEGSEAKPLPYIVIIIDELADLMMLDGQNVEASITRLAQMARAVGIHLVLATQRPSVDVITGLIKANFPARMSFRVATKIDSRTILDANGAEALLGRGDMLYLPNGSARVHRVHAPFVTEKEIAAVVEFWKAQGAAQYQENFLQAPREDGESGAGSDGGGDGEDAERRAVPGRRANRAGIRQGLDFPAATPAAHRLRPRRSPDRPDGTGRNRRRSRWSEAARGAEASGLAERSRRRDAVVSRNGNPDRLGTPSPPPLSVKSRNNKAKGEIPRKISEPKGLQAKISYCKELTYALGTGSARRRRWGRESLSPHAGDSSDGEGASKGRRSQSCVIGKPPLKAKRGP